MFNSQEVLPELRKLIGWRDHYDLAEIPALSAGLKVTTTGEFYQDYHPICDLKNVRAIKPDAQTLESYLDQKTNAAILQMCNEILLRKRDARISKGIIKDTELIDTNAWIKDQVVSEGRFVGIQINLKNNIGLKAIIKRFSGQFTENQTITFYLYHSSQQEPIKTYDLTVTKAPNVSWFSAEAIDLFARNDEFSGGYYYFGYYEEDVTGFALSVKNDNWDLNNKNCGTCSKKVTVKDYSILSNSIAIAPFYATTFTKGELPSPDDIKYDYNYTWGMNLSVSVVCDYTQFLIDNAISMKNLIGLSVVHQILKDAQYSQNLNYIEENLRYIITRDLEGARDSNYVNIADQIEAEMNAVRFDQSSLSKSCLSVMSYKTPIYNQA